jgi:hypothetical protein
LRQHFRRVDVWFESRELKPYAEPVSADEIRAGSVYFSVNFVDGDMLYPTLEPVVFVGVDLDDDEVGMAYFQDLDSYRRGVRYDDTGKDAEATFSKGSVKELNHIFEFERALEVLMACSLRRKEAR